MSANEIASALVARAVTSRRGCQTPPPQYPEGPTAGTRDDNSLVARINFFRETGRAGNFSGAALLVTFNLLFTHLNGRTGRCDPAIARLAEETGLTPRSVKRAIRELEESGWWIIGHRKGAIRFGGRSNTYVPNFAKGNDKPVTILTEVVTDPLPADGASNGQGGDSTGTKVVTNESPKPGTNREESESPPLTPPRASEFESVFSFEEFWRLFPAREGENPKKLAQLEFDKALKRGGDPAAIIYGAANYADWVDRHLRRADRRFIPQAARWLREDRWNDYQEIPRAPPRRLGMGLFE